MQPYPRLDDVEVFLSELKVVRFHVTTTYSTLRSYRDDFRLVYSCKKLPLILPLYWQDRQVQTNMIVLDSHGGNVVYLPHDECYDLERAYIVKLWERYVSECATKSKVVAPEPPDVLLAVANFELPQPVIGAALGWLKEEVGRNPGSEALEALSTYIACMCTWYIPLVETPKDRSDDRYVLVRSGLDYYQWSTSPSGTRHSSRPGGPVGEPSPADWILFALSGVIHLRNPVPLGVFLYAPWTTTESLHLRVRLPAGLEIRGCPRTDFDFALKGSYFHQALRASTSEVYAYVGGFEVIRILNAIEGGVGIEMMEPAPATDSMGFRFTPFSDGTAKSSATKAIAVPPQGAQKSAGMKSYPPLDILTEARLSLAMYVLLGLFWVVVGAVYAYRLLGGFDFEGFFVLFTALLIVVVATAIASIDKPTIRLPVSVHTILAVAAFFGCLVFKPF